MKVAAIAIALGLAVSVVGCASTSERRVARLNEGVAKYRAGDCAGAYKEWLPLAQAGYSVAQNNIGSLFRAGCPAANVSRDYALAMKYYSLSAKQGYITAHHNIGSLYEYGLGVPVDRNTAIAQYTYSARWGTTESIDALRRLGASVPDADLLAAARAQANQRAASSSGTDLAIELLGAALEGAAAGLEDANNRPYSTYSPPANSGSTSRSAQPNVPAPSKIYAPPACSSDFECGYGKKCAKPMYQSTGTCLQVVNEHGVPGSQLSPPGGEGVRTTPSCRYNTDCPIGFRCDDKLKACVR